MLLSAAILLLQSAAAPLPAGQLFLGRSSASTKESVPALLVVSGPDTASVPVSVRVIALPSALLWWRGADRECGPPPPDARTVLDWSANVHGDEQLALCARPQEPGPVRLAASISALQPDGSWRRKTVLSEVAAPAASALTAGVVLAFVTAVLGFVFGLAATWWQQKGERAKRRMELAEERRKEGQRQAAAERTQRMEIDRKVFESVTAEVQSNVAALRAYAASAPLAGEKPMILSLAGIGAVLADAATASYLRNGEGQPYLARMNEVYVTMRDYNRGVRHEADPARRRDLAERTRARLDEQLQP